MGDGFGIVPVLLCGGSGTRLWPLSRKSYPKQFVPLLGDESLFQASARRVQGDGFSDPLIVTNDDFRFIVTEQLSAVGINPGAILIEPDSRNTAPAILATAIWMQQRDPDALMVVLPSDHVVSNCDAFRQAVMSGREAARSGKIVTFGIPPRHPETGYGYLELAEETVQGGSVIDLVQFVEKPNAERAEQLMASGRHLWNSGIFLFSVATILQVFQRYYPSLLPPVTQAVDEGTVDLGFFRFEPGAWSDVEAISIDYAVMEQADNLVVVPFAGDWSDLGGWEAVWREGDSDTAGVMTAGQATAIDCRNSFLRSEDDSLELVALGLENVIAIAMPDAVLVANANRAQDVRQVVSALKAKQSPQAESFPIKHRPWGWFESLVKGPRFQVKRITVNPGQSLSLQSHHHRAEHWIVVQGTAKVTRGKDVQLLAENESIYIPLGMRHRLENPGNIPVMLIEVQTGAYLGEDDIVRHHDIYARG